MTRTGANTDHPNSPRRTTRRFGVAALGIGLLSTAVAPIAARPAPPLEARDLGVDPPPARHVEGDCHCPPPFRGGPPPPPPFPGARDLDDLRLDRETRSSVESLIAAFRTAARALRHELRASEERLARLWSAAIPDANAIEALIGDIGTLHTRLAQREAALRLGVLRLLDPEQRSAFERRFLRPGMHVPPPPPPPPPAPADLDDFQEW